jgi:hypothetical protein
MSLREKIEGLNQADLSGLMGRLAKLREAFEQEMGADAQHAVTIQDLQSTSRETGLTPEQLIEALETAKRRGLI